ncbi:TPA: DNA methyltransferase [Enterococcus hirae]
MDTRLMQQIKEILKEFPQYWDGEELQRPIVIDDLKSYDALLISALLKNQKIRENYSVKAGDVVIFKVQEFIDILRYKDYLADSYTKYSNTIGLSSEGKYLQYNTDVVLDFPYKDCVLEGGMTKEEVGKEEVFYNEVIARDEIDTLLAPKAFVNAKKYDAEGEHEISSFSDEDNLIIKGNNLLALHSLKERYAGKVKCVFIDPPYYFNNSKPADTFAYNSNFKLSSWLVFMKNRLEIARELLMLNGTVYITISDDGAHYLKVLCDSIFGIENFIADITWQSRKSVSSDGLISISSNHLLVYAREKNKINKKNFRLSLDVEGFNLEDEQGKFKVEPFDAPNIRKNLSYEITNPNTKESYYPPQGRHWRTTEIEYNNLLKRNRIRFGSSGNSKPQLKVYLQDAIEQGKGKASTTIWDDLNTESIIWSTTDTTTNATKHQQKLFKKVIFENPKPENLIQRALELSTDEKDIVIDFFMGSATTQAVSMKMNRRFIGIEQMDYINTVSVPRLQKVIEGEQGGISKDVNWQGGGSFIYAELMELNQVYMNKIDQALTKEELANLWDELDNNADLNFQLDKEKLTNELLKEYDEEEGSITFNDLTFDEQKEIFKKALDKNQLYVSYSEIEDKNVIISDNDKAFNHNFYNNEEG